MTPKAPMTPADRAKRKRECLQRIRKRWRRIDYYPSADALAAIEVLGDEGENITDSINSLVEAEAGVLIGRLPESFRHRG